MFDYDFSIIHLLAKTIKDIDACRHIHTLISQYIVHAYSMRYRDIISRPYTFSYYIFIIDPILATL